MAASEEYSRNGAADNGIDNAALTMSRSFAIIVEWENARFAELARTCAMLRVVRAQLEALHASEPVAAEMILLVARSA